MVIPKPKKLSSFKTTVITSNECLGERFQIGIIPSLQILKYCYERPPIEGKITIGIVENATGDRPFTSFTGENLVQSYQVPPEFHLQGKNATTTNYNQLSKKVNILHSIHHANAN